MKKVRVVLEVDEHFIRALRANIELKKSALEDRPPTPSEQLAITFLAEARGGLVEEVHQTIIPDWRPHLEVISELRTVRE